MTSEAVRVGLVPRVTTASASEPVAICPTWYIGAAARVAARSSDLGTGVSQCGQEPRTCILVVGSILVVRGMAGHAVGGRKHYF